MAQYILHELWAELEGEMEGATTADVRDLAETFEERTQHLSTWARTLGPRGSDLYHFISEQDAPVTYQAVRQHFAHLTIDALRSTLDALLYHGLVHCHGRGRRRAYQIAGQMYLDWCLAAGKIGSRPAADDAYTHYEAALRRLLERLGPDHPLYSEAGTYRQRLLENIAQTRQHGDTETRRAERSEIVTWLNDLAMTAGLDISFVVE